MNDQAFTVGVVLGAAVGAAIALLVRDQRRPERTLAAPDRAGLTVGAVTDADLLAARQAAALALAQLPANTGRPISL